MNKIIVLGLLSDETFIKRHKQTRRVISTNGVCETLTAGMGMGGASLRRLSYKMIQKVGDRDKAYWSVKDCAFTIPANPMSDRIQLVIEIYEDGRNNLPKQ